MLAHKSQARQRTKLRPAPGVAILAALLAVATTSACKAKVRALADHALEKTVLRIGVLTREAPHQLRLTGTRVQMLVDGTPLDDAADTFQLEVETRAGGGLRFRLAGEAWRNARRIVVLSPQAIRVQTSGAPDRPRIYPGDLELSEDDRREDKPDSPQSRTAPARRALHATLRIDALQYARAAALSELGAALLNDLPAESTGAPGWRRELLRAASAAALSYALANRGRHANERYDLCDLTHCLHFPGLSDAPSPGEDGAIRAPSEAESQSQAMLILLTQANAPLASYFHSTCGGRLARPSSYWPRATREDPYFRTGPDQLDNGPALCAASPHSRWSAVLTREEFQNYAGITRPTAPGGEANWLLERTDLRVTRLRRANGPASETAESAAFLSAAGRARGWNFIKSNDFTVSAAGDAIRLRGRGLGHGIGLCQWGARELARRGKTAEEILAFYYPGAKLARVRYAAP